MDRQLKQTALPCWLSGEHFRRHYRALCHQRPRADVDGSVGICVRGVTARDAAKGGLIGAVLLVDAPARGALARRVARINEDHGDASTLCLVGDESSQLSETPISQPCALIAAGRYPLANALEFFKGDPPRGAFSIHHDSLGYDLVQGELPERGAVPRYRSEPVTRRVAPLKRRLKASGLFRRRQHSERGNELHFLKSRRIALRSPIKERRAWLAIAIPLPPEDGSFSRRPL